MEVPHLPEEIHNGQTVSEQIRLGFEILADILVKLSPQRLFSELVVRNFPVKVESRFRNRFISGVVQRAEIRVSQSIFNGDSLVRVENEHLLQQIDCLK